ncbi:MAG: hypothetical protein LQ348_003114 [Seirophora lacunosa]|nr:MAG: hypothetical protein LQ348_003114 [Seirophora lacunosa]
MEPDSTETDTSFINLVQITTGGSGISHSEQNEHENQLFSLRLTMHQPSSPPGPSDPQPIAGHLAKALSTLAPAIHAHATTSYTKAFNWAAVFTGLATAVKDDASEWTKELFLTSPRSGQYPVRRAPPWLVFPPGLTPRYHDPSWSALVSVKTLPTEISSWLLTMVFDPDDQEETLHQAA